MARSSTAAEKHFSSLFVSSDISVTSRCLSLKFPSTAASYISQQHVGLAALHSKFQERVMKLIILEVTPALTLHEIPDVAGKCQTGQIAKFWGAKLFL